MIRSFVSEISRAADDLPTHDGQSRPDVLNVLVWHGEIIPVEHGDVAMVADGRASGRAIGGAGPVER